MQAPTPENSDEITVFIIEGTYRLATISMNDYGFLLSAQMAQTYLDRAVHVLESKRSSDKALLNEVGRLKVSGKAMAREYAQFERFCSDSERFDRVETKTWVEWICKCGVRAISGRYLVTVSQHLAYKIRTFHSRICLILTEN
ncbi:MAG: hypothetical protein MUP33_11045 [Polaromonas sp.]|nr:hypothetical protein [Polaromonas sp.]